MDIVSKVLLCGDGYVGKTSLRKSFMGLKLNSKYISTVGAELSVITKKIEVGNKTYSTKFIIWDLAGQPLFSTVRPRYYEGANVAFLVYDVTNRESFENIENWIIEIKTHNTYFPISLVLVANKIDLITENNPFVSTQEGLDLARLITKKYLKNEEYMNVLYLETSALTGENVNLAFKELAAKFIELSIHTAQQN